MAADELTDDQNVPQPHGRRWDDWSRKKKKSAIMSIFGAIRLSKVPILKLFSDRFSAPGFISPDVDELRDFESSSQSRLQPLAPRGERRRLSGGSPVKRLQTCLECG